MIKKLFFATALFTAICSTTDATNSIKTTLEAGSAGGPSGEFSGSEFWYVAPSFMPAARVEISSYDTIIRRIASDRGFDWRLISAVVYAESQFDHTAVSSAGAVGLMQVMPSVAKGLGISPAEIIDPHINVELGVSHLEQIARTFRFPRNISEHDRLSIVLAAYNCGVGHVLDARRLAVKYGENHNSWSVVAKYLCLKSEPEYFEDEVVRCGIFRDNVQTLGFVRKVMRNYDSYCELAIL